MNTSEQIPTIEESKEAKAALERLAQRALETAGQSAVIVKVTVGDLEVAIPVTALNILTEVLAELANGNAVTVLPHHAELTTQEAADVLNVSRPHLVKLLEDGAIEFRMVGTHRRVRAADLMAYKRQMRQQSRKALQELADQAQELGLGY